MKGMKIKPVKKSKKANVYQPKGILPLNHKAIKEVPISKYT